MVRWLFGEADVRMDARALTVMAVGPHAISGGMIQAEADSLLTLIGATSRLGKDDIRASQYFVSEMAR